MADTTNTDTTAASGAASLGPLNDRAIKDAIRNAYDLGYRDGAHAGASATHQVEQDHGGALIHALYRALAAPAAQEAGPAPMPDGYDGGTMTGNLVTLRFNDQASADRWFTAFCDGYDAAPRPQADAGADAPEGCTPADAQILRKANHDLAAESFELQTALRGIVDQAGKALARFDIAAAPQAPAAPDMESVLIDGVAYQTPAPVAAELLRLHLEAMEAPAAPMSAQPMYQDSTPGLHVGDSSFEDWFQQQPFATQTGVKQIARDAYAAGMGDPLVIQALAPAAGAAPTDAEIEAFREAFDWEGYTDPRVAQSAFGRAALARWGAAAPAQEAEDAARYRWLRDETEWEPFAIAWLCKMDIYGYPSRAMDAAIDAARARQKGGS